MTPRAEQPVVMGSAVDYSTAVFPTGPRTGALVTLSAFGGVDPSATERRRRASIYFARPAVAASIPCLERRGSDVQANLPTEQPAPTQAPWLPRPDANPGRQGDPRPSARQGPFPVVRLKGRRRTRIESPEPSRPARRFTENG